MGRGTLKEVGDRSEDPRGDPIQVGDLRGGPGRVGGPLGRSGTTKGTNPMALDGLMDPWGGLGG